MSQALEIALKLLACLVLVFALRKLELGRWGTSDRARRRILVAMAVAGAFAYFNFGRFHTDGTPIHLWDQFHYVIGSKYFPELGYDGIYAATLEARQHDLPKRVRDLRTNRVVPLESLQAHRREVRARFSNARWQEFSADINRWWLQDNILLDHGYNATPTHVAVSRLLSPWFEFRTRTLYVFMLVDWVLLGVAALAINWGFGLEAMAMVSLCFGLGACTRYFWTGGAFLRMDYFAALAVAAALVKKGHWFGVGAALAYATCVRLFPVLFLATLLVTAIFGRHEHLKQMKVRRLLAGFTLAALICLGLGACAGRGWHAYQQFASRITTHSGKVLANDIGVKVAMLESSDNLLGRHIDPRSHYDVPEVVAELERTEVARRPWPLIAAIVTSALVLALAIRRASGAVSAFAFGGLLVFTLLKVNWYYGTIFLFTVLIHPLRSARVFLTCTAATYVAALGIGLLDRWGFLHIYAFSVGLAIMVALGGYFVWWALMQHPPDSPGKCA